MPARYKLILVEPKYQVNLGYMARVAMNFGVRRLYVVRPRAKLTGRDAIKYSKHARALLEGAKEYGSLDEALRGCGLVIGRVGVRKRLVLEELARQRGVRVLNPILQEEREGESS